MQSLFNLVSLFKDQADFYLISKDRDIDGAPSRLLELTHDWTHGPNDEKIYFTSSITPFLIFRLIKKERPHSILINGIFNINTTIPGLIAGKLFNTNIIISPRGMLQAWGLKRNKIVKQIFLFLLRLLLRKNETWHATDRQEKEDIIKYFGPKQNIYVASNIPKKVFLKKTVPFRDVNGKVKLVFLSLINPNKNLHLIIDAVNRLDNFTLDIYGPIIDKNYWMLCKSKMTDASKITYKGSVVAWEVIDILTEYHFFVLPTEGENFGHAIFDALSAGLPVIITKKTPWKDLDKKSAGFYLDESKHSLDTILNEILEMNMEVYQNYRKHCSDYVTDYWTDKDFFKEYNFLLS